VENNIFIPKKIRVGFQKREDTYTHKLAYVIYYDAKGKIRKEKSWESWRDQKIQSIEFDNEPTGGFVLNKKVGGYKYDWNVRNTYVRVYDSRDFEFEISVPNLLYILENTSSIKGKGLEGEFVYGWSGTELVLVPTSSPDYVEMSKLNELRHNDVKVSSKDLVLGATYKHKSNVSMVYMGRFEKYEDSRWHEVSNGKSKGMHYYFVELPCNRTIDFKTFKSLGDNFIELVDGTCVDNYAKLFDKLEHEPMYSPIDDSKTVYTEFTLVNFIRHLKGSTYHPYYSSIKGSQHIDIRINKDYHGGYSVSSYTTRMHRKYSTVEELFADLKPCSRKRYLANGILFDTSR
jgi:hypothetical protein